MFTRSLTNRSIGITALTAAMASTAIAADSDLAKYKEAERIGEAHLATFDALDFEVFTNQKWDRLKESHDKKIVVHWPDSRQTKGLEVHTQDLKAMFVYPPDTRIKEHPIKIASGEPSPSSCLRPVARPSRHRQVVQAEDVHRRPLEEWRDGRRAFFLGQPDIHESDRSGAVRDITAL